MLFRYTGTVTLRFLEKVVNQFRGDLVDAIFYKRNGRKSGLDLTAAVILWCDSSRLLC